LEIAAQQQPSIRENSRFAQRFTSDEGFIRVGVLVIVVSSHNDYIPECITIIMIIS
jgi:hypothetical protein